MRYRWLPLFRSQMGPVGKTKNLGAGCFLLPQSYLLQSIKISLNPFVTCGYMSPQTNRNAGFLLFFLNKCLVSISLSSWLHPFEFVKLATPLYDEELRAAEEAVLNTTYQVSSSIKKAGKGAPLLLPSPTRQLHCI